MTNIEIVKKLIGAIEPVGESNEDGKRLENIREWIDLTDSMLHELRIAAQYRGRHEASMKTIGKAADEFLNAIREHL